MTSQSSPCLLHLKLQNGQKSVMTITMKWQYFVSKEDNNTVYVILYFLSKKRCESGIIKA